jgi:hypothetical protein
MKLKKLKMPPREEIDMAELDSNSDGSMGLEGEPMGDEMMGEAEGESMEPGKEGPAADMLADFSDDDLLAEVKKRGLMGQLGEEGAEEMEAEDEEYMS